ncbi:MAG: hypothetical protein JWR39_2498 [Devosia sp.]|nr:hypothetical protein [Devosia sp.]
MDELLAQFILEARELVQAAIDDLFALEAEPGDKGRIDSAFRAVHTLKGSVGLFDLPALHSALHAAEDNLGRVRSGTASLDVSQIDAIVAVLEWIDRCVDDLEAHGAVSPQRLEQAGDVQAALRGDPTVIAATAGEAASTDWAMALAARIGGEARVALRYRPHPECFFGGDDPIALIARIPGLSHLSIEPGQPWPAPELLDPFRSNLLFEALSTAPPSDVEAIFRLVPDQVKIVPLGAPSASASEPLDAGPGSAGADGTRGLRVDPARIDMLLDLVGELMTAKNGMAGLAAMAGAIPGAAELARSIVSTQQDLDRLSGALYGGILQTRMVPLAHAFHRLPRMVRDLSRRLGKPTHLQIEGDTIEADKTIVDELFEPLLHLVRNAMDHGIEAAEERLALGKPALAKLSLRVLAEGDHIVVSLSDDGRGIDPAAIRAAALRNGLVSAERATLLDDRDTLDLLFAAGFSTATIVSDLSGRGVGLDAVRADVTRLGGTVGITSRVGHGTTTLLRLPISFAMTQLLVVSVGGERYGVPMPAVLETVRVKQEAVSAIRDNRAFVLRDRTIALLSLSELLGLPETVPVEEMTVLVLELGGQRIGIIIDAITERIETVTRPLTGLLTGVRGIGGSTVLGNGQVLLVLDIAELVG